MKKHNFSCRGVFVIKIWDNNLGQNMMIIKFFFLVKRSGIKVPNMIFNITVQRKDRYSDKLSEREGT